MFSKNDEQEFRITIAERDSYRCTDCGGTFLLSLHHIVPRSHTSRKNPATFLWSEKNCCLLCVYCHAEVHTYANRQRLLRLLKDRFEYTYNEKPFTEYVIE